jgi:MOSC domain-containing protein YiiM
LGAEPNELSSTERGRAEATAFHFVRHAYDRPGDDRAEYLSGVSQAVVSPEFFGSPGGEVVDTIADRVADGGVASPATFEGFQMGHESLDRIEGVATFRLGGERRYEQELELVRWGATWRVISAGEVREAEQ